MKRNLVLVLLMVLPFFFLSCSDDVPSVRSGTGWAVGWTVDKDTGESSVKILKTSDAGVSWALQTLPGGYENCRGNDISAVNPYVAWAAIGEAATASEGGGILHTSDGATWRLQALPDGMISRHIKSIKGLGPTEAWAVSLQGDVLHTLDGGIVWGLVPVRTADGEPIEMTQVNRMDATGSDIWIVDAMGGNLGVIHSPDGGLTWRREFLPDM